MLRTNARRRTVVRIAIGAYVLVALGATSACIFDRSTYQGGGREDQGGVARDDTSATATETTTPTTTTTATTTTDSGNGVAIKDSGGAG